MENKLYSMRKGFKNARTRKGLKQADVAQAMNVSLKTVMNWEQGISNPDLEMALKLTELFDCDLDYLVGRMDERTHDIKAIHDMTGLSAKAIEKICAEKATINGSPVRSATAISLSHLIEADGFQDFMRAYQTFLIAADRLKITTIPEAVPYPINEDGAYVIDGSTRSPEGAQTIIDTDKVILRVDDAARYFMHEAAQALMRLCESDYQESNEMCKKNSRQKKRTDSNKNRGHE